jgi:hydroxymethylglutaryl-CoA lyase
MSTVTIREVGPRDGLQSEAPVSIETRVALIGGLVAAGLRQVEVAAFVSPRAVPSMAGAAEVIASLERHDRVSYWALVPNLRGAELALEAKVDGITVTVSASEAYSQKNVHMSVDESVAEAERIGRFLGKTVPVDAVISCAFGSPYEGDVAPTVIAEVAKRLLHGGASSVTLADTTGMATPRRIGDLLAQTGADVGLHFHETRGTGLLNAYAALQAGARRFDTSVGGLGGSPFAAGAAGNVATEDLVHLLDDLGIETGVDLERLIEVSHLFAEAVGHPVPSRVAAVGPRWRLSQP